MAKSKTINPLTLNDEDRTQVLWRVQDIHAAVHLAYEVACEHGVGDEMERAIRVLNMARRELQAVEDMLDPIEVGLASARQANGVAHA